MFYTYNKTTDFLRPSDYLNYSKHISQLEKELLNKCSVSSQADIDSYIDEVETARVRWACISSKTQRASKLRNVFDVEVYNNITKIGFHYEGIKGQKAPNRSGMPVQKFSKKSRNRMMDKMKRMKKDDLPLPYFITLTYHRNMVDFEKAKNHLNTFFQRFRRIDRTAKYKLNRKTGNQNKYWVRDGNFKYFWKMEAQSKNFEKSGRCAIHFHLMLFLPEKLFPAGWQGESQENRLEFVKMRISSAWNEIAEPDDNIHLQVGTNCRRVYNWRMATGYLFKYMKKEVEGEIWKDQNTGRFWGFSNNFDFRFFYRKEYDLGEIKKIEERLTELQNISFQQYLAHEKNNIEREEKKNQPEHIRKKRIEKILERIKRQKRRKLINIEKIKRGSSVQIEIHHNITDHIF